MNTLVQTQESIFVAGLRKTLGKTIGAVALHEPEFLGNEWGLVKDCLDSTFVSSVGKYVPQLESMLANFTGAKHVIALANGTAALQLALHLAGVKVGDEVIVPALSFVATANAVVHCGGVPHFVDCNRDTLGLDPAVLREYLLRKTERVSGGLRNIETGRRVAAIVPMHAYGHPVDLSALLDLADGLGLPVVEDAAEGIGSTFHGQHVGTFGLLGILSFNGNKTITTGGGGAILTNNPELARHAKHLATTAKVSHQWEFYHDEVAWNFRMPNINAALGCAQMERLPQMLADKRRLAERYQETFLTIDGLSFAAEPKNSRSNYWLNAIILDAPDLEMRNRLLGAANDSGYQCRPAWTLLHRLPMYSKSPRAPLPTAEQLEASLINVPSSPKLLRDRRD